MVRAADLKYYTKTRDFTDVHVVGGRSAYPARVSKPPSAVYALFPAAPLHTSLVVLYCMCVVVMLAPSWCTAAQVYSKYRSILCLYYYCGYHASKNVNFGQRYTPSAVALHISCTGLA